MQDQQFAREAGPRASWYLARGNERYGPLGNGELLLLAKQGGLKADDLLWRSGFDTWKTVQAVCGLKQAFPITKQQDVSTKDAEYVPNTALNNDATEMISARKDVAKRTLKNRLYGELKAFLTIFAYLWLVFSVFLVHEWIVLADNHIGFRFYGVAAVNALILSKIMLIAEDLGFADRFHARPLIVPIAYKSVLFSVLLVAAYILEEIVIGWFHGKSVAESFPSIGGGGLLGTVCVTALLCVALVPFFAFREIARLVGEAEFRLIMLGPAKAAKGMSEKPSSAAAIV